MLGCGYVANMYRLTLPMHPELRLVGVHDREPARAETMARMTGARAYPGLDALLADPESRIVLNLTNPRAHYATTKALLEAGKHVYTEKPLALDLGEARALVELAEARGLMLCSAPCTFLNPVAQTLWKAVREEAAGPVRLVHAEMEDGMVPRAPTAKWINEMGVAWPAIDEFETGCTVEHAGYVLTWLCAMFGPAERVTAHSERILPDKVPGMEIDDAPDFSVGCIRFRSGVTARLTNGIYAGHDHRLSLWGDEGALLVDDPRSDTSPVRLRRWQTLRRRRYLGRARRLALLGGRERIARYRGSQVRDFCRVLADMAAALAEGREPRLGARFALHVTELTLACQAGAGASRLTTGFPPVAPMPWAA
jgi:predicted dehydrogenase